MFIFAQQEANIWNGDAGTSALWLKIGIGFLVGMGIMVALLLGPTRLRRPVIVTATFLAGLFWILDFLWPKVPDDFDPVTTEPTFVQGVALWLKDSNGVVGNFSNILTAFLLGLGIYSLVSIHGKRFLKMQRDWFFSMLLLLSIVAMALFGYTDWYDRTFTRTPADVDLQPGFFNQGKDLLFDGMLQVMEAAMFSIIAFYIFSAAYRAFRIRSVESTILLATGFIVMIGLMGAVVVGWNSMVSGMGGDVGFLANFKLSEIKNWVTDTVQTSAIRGVNFGVGIGALAMGMRLWLSLERGGVSG